MTVKSGVYREVIVPRRGGTGPGAMVGYETAPRRSGPGQGLAGLGRPVGALSAPTSSSGARGRRVVRVTLPGYNPFAIENATAADVAIMPWAAPWADRPRSP